MAVRRDSRRSNAPAEQHLKRTVRSFYERKVDAPYAQYQAGGQYPASGAYPAGAAYQPSNQLEEDQFARSQFVHFTPLEPQFEDNINKNLIVPNGSIAYLQCKIKHLGDRMVSWASPNWWFSSNTEKPIALRVVRFPLAYECIHCMRYTVGFQLPHANKQS